MRERIQIAATRLFATRGYDGTSISAIAAEVGISPGALYWHFENKEDLLFSILSDGMADYANSLDAEMAGRTGPVELLRAYAIGHVKAILTRPAMRHASLFTDNQMAASLSEDRAEAIRHLGRPYMRRLRQILREGDEQGLFHVIDLTATSFAIVHMCEHVRVWFGPVGVEEIAEEHGEYALRVAGYGLGR